MKQRRVVIRNPSGLHARPAALFVQSARRYRSAVRLATERGVADGKSIVGVLKLGATPGTALTIECEGDDEEAAAAALAGLVEAGLGEGVAIYRSRVTEVGPEVAELAREGLLVFFAEGAPPELRSLSILHRPEGPPTHRLRPGDEVRLGTWTGRVTAVGEAVDRNLAELGHLVLRFGGAPQAELPGQLCVAGDVPPLPAPGAALQLVRPAEEGGAT